MARKFSELRSKMSPDAQSRAKSRTAEMLCEVRLTDQTASALAASDTLREALTTLVEACEEEFENEDTRRDCSDDESVSYNDSAITFGMFRKARALLRSVEPIPKKKDAP